MEKDTLGKFVLAARLRARLTLVEFGKRFGIPNQTLLEIEKGNVPQPDTYRKLLGAMLKLKEDTAEMERLYEDAYIKRREGRLSHKNSQQRRQGR